MREESLAGLGFPFLAYDRNQLGAARVAYVDGIRAESNRHRAQDFQLNPWSPALSKAC